MGLPQESDDLSFDGWNNPYDTSPCPSLGNVD
jgi:hypothetical protein